MMFFTIPVKTDGTPDLGMAKNASASHALAAAQDRAESLPMPTSYIGILVIGNTINDEVGRAYARIFPIKEKTVLSVSDDEFKT